MMMESTSDNLSYATVSFPEGQNQKPFHPKRRNTKYTEILYPDATTTVDTTQQVAVTEDPKPVPRVRTQSLDRRTKPTLENVASNPLYELPPVPTRVESQEEKHHEREASPQPAMEDKDPFHNVPQQPDGGDPFLKDPFTTDPFAGSSEEWSDNTAFYDRPPPPRPYVPGQSVPLSSDSTHVETETEIDDCSDTANFTGDSSYEDASEFLKTIQAKHRPKDKQQHRSPSPLQSKGSKQAAIFAPASEVFLGSENQGGECEVAVAPSQRDPNTTKQSPPGKALGPYEYPVALDKFPLKKGEDEKAHSFDEPPLHTLSYTSKVQGLTRHESLSRGRRGMPLPPVPDSKEQPPSGPQGQGGRFTPPHSPPPLPARPMPTKDNPLPPGTQAPALPPFNYSWGNKKPLRSEDHPPLPPRRKDPSPSFNGGPVTDNPPQTNSPPEKSAAVAELLALGYTLSEIERALVVANKDITLAKLILKEFGGRH